MSPLEEQQFAAVLMWTCVTIIFLVPAVVVTIQLLTPLRAHSSAATEAASSSAVSQPLDDPELEVV